MSKADRMFENLGYIKTFENQYSNLNLIVYSKDHGGYHMSTIAFRLDDKTVQADENYEAKFLNIHEHIAIHEKLKELGWL